MIHPGYLLLFKNNIRELVIIPYIFFSYRITKQHESRKQTTNQAIVRCGRILRFLIGFSVMMLGQTDIHIMNILHI